MNGIEKITARIESDAMAEAKLIAEASERECAEIKADFETKAQEEYKKHVRAGVRECELRVQRLGSTAAMESKKSILSMKQELVSRAFERAKHLLVSLPDAEYTDFLAKQAAGASMNGLEELIFNARDRERFGSKAAKAANKLLEEKGVQGKLTVSEECRNIYGGVIVKQGDIEVNCSVETLTELYRNDLATQVAAEMFQGAL